MVYVLTKLWYYFLQRLFTVSKREDKKYFYCINNIHELYKFKVSKVIFSIAVVFNMCWTCVMHVYYLKDLKERCNLQGILYQLQCHNFFSNWNHIRQRRHIKYFTRTNAYAVVTLICVGACAIISGKLPL